MNLSRKIALWVIGVWLIAFSGIIAISFHSARNFFIERLQHGAQETATVLASNLENQDKNTLHTLLQKRVEQSDASQIVVRDATGSIEDRSVDSQSTISHAPAFFAYLAAMPSPVASTPVLRAGKQSGTIEVTADNRSAVDSLWTYSLHLVLWSLILTGLACALILSFVSRLLKPLKKTTRQARDLLNDEYTIQSQIPKTPELRDLTLAMNKMVRKIQTLFQEQSRRVELLRQQAFQDPLTGLGNRRFFLHQVTSLISDVEGFVPYYLLFIAIDGLSELNEKEGYVQGDKIIIEAHHAITTFVETLPASCIARVGGSQFGILIQARDVGGLDHATLRLQQNLNERLQKVGNCRAFIGGAPCRFLQPMDSLLRETDKALQIAREDASSVHIFHDAAGLPTGEMLDELLTKGRLALYWQSITNQQRVLHRKMFARIISPQGEEFGTSSLLPFAEQAGLAWKIDNMILKALVGVDPHLLEPFALSISSNTVMEKAYLDKYLQSLSELSGALRRLIRVEISESLVMKSPEAVKACIAELQKLGIGVGIDQAGVHFGSMDYLKDLPIHYFKLHGSIAKDIVENESKDVFIRHFTAMAKTLEIQVIATQIDEVSQWAALNSAGIIWGQGRLLGGVEPVPAFNIPAVAGEKDKQVAEVI